MVAEQIIEITESRRVIIDLPRTLPVGKARFSIFPMIEIKSEEKMKGTPVNGLIFEEDSFEEAIAAADEIIEKHIEAFKALAKTQWASSYLY